MRLYLSSLSPWNSTYSDSDGHLLFKVDSPPTSGPRKVTFYRALPDVTLPTSERQLWEERHFFETHASSQRDHPELDGQGSGLAQDLIMEENRDSPSLSDSSDSVYEFPLRDFSHGPPSPSRSGHSESHPFWIKEHWVHFADIDYHSVRETKFNVMGNEFEAGEFFAKEGHKPLFGRSRTFTAGDGKRYRWDLRDRGAKLYLCADKPGTSQSTPSQELVAEFQPPSVTNSSNSLRKKVIPPTLVIYPPGEAILEIIIVTFVYGEILSRDGSGQSTPSPRDAQGRRSSNKPAGLLLA